MRGTTRMPINLATSALIVCALCALLLLLPASADALLITVNADTDAQAVDPANCELREAIEAANTNAAVDGCSAGFSSDAIMFGAPLVAPITIQPATELPPLTSPITLNATDASNCAGDRTVTLDGSLTAGADGFELDTGSSGSTICGFRIGDFDDSGIRIGTDSNDVLFNRIGLFIPPATAHPNTVGVSLESTADDNDIGAVGGENVISGNTNVGVDIRGGDNNRIRANTIGTTANGNTAVPNGFGINVGASVPNLGSANNTIGGSGAGQGNLISGNGAVGLAIDSGAQTGVTANVVQGNKIGTNAAGTAAVPNVQQGIRVISNATANEIGGDGAGEGNLISGNGGAGVDIRGADANVVQGNFIGTDLAGEAALPNGGGGVEVGLFGASEAEDNRIGGPDTSADATGGGARNLISGNNQNGVRVHNAGTDGNAVEGNFIGTDAEGFDAIPNSQGGSFAGVVLENSVTNNRIGGTAPGAGNVISGNDAWGVLTFAGVGSGNVIQGNLIGPDRQGLGPVTAGSQETGVGIDGNNTTLGGTAAGAGNTIATNVDDGVMVVAGTGNAILGNSIWTNGVPLSVDNLGIDLFTGGGGLSPNDADANNDSDVGANNLQNFPDISAAQTNSVDTTIQGTLQSLASTTFRVEFFSNPSCSISGNGEGRVFLGATEVTSDATGSAPIDATVNPSTAAHRITATATRLAAGPGSTPTDTSEFSACVTSTAKAEPPVPPAPDPGTGGGGGGTGGGTGGGGTGGGGGGGGGGTTPDTKAPLLDLGGEGKQSKDDKVKVEVSCDEACTVDASGTIKVPKIKNGKAKGKEKFDLKGADGADLAAGDETQLKLEFSKKTEKAVKKAMKEKEKSTAKVTATATDAAGNETDEVFEIKVKK